ncbi:hypothetical protein Pan189_05710 [Stratiformator vulcanicus]|uniref:Uncharacterized protein n=1 Tax=Stratiformator vulcanicus TaxID=2527980 RepID=A0A517QX28_9PLAN|nr:hypothetical protein Pan189_05710 [Stratiformator vulcanicus]
MAGPNLQWVARPNGLGAAGTRGDQVRGYHHNGATRNLGTFKFIGSWCEVCNCIAGAMLRLSVTHGEPRLRLAIPRG